VAPQERSLNSYGQFCPVSKAAEVICQRWTPLILRELLVGSTRFNEIRRGVPTCSPALLSKRLKELESAGVIERNPHGTSYTLTEAGRELFPLIQALGEWGQRWVRSDYGPDELDPGLLMWDVRRFLQPGGIGEGRVVVQFVFPSMPARRRYYWLVDSGDDVDLCFTDPGMEVDVQIKADLRTLTQVWMGDAHFEEALRTGQIEVLGPRPLTRGLSDWFGQHPILAQVPRGR
jgi:DNA-binding HxlR family transcriptional regulator